MRERVIVVLSVCLSVNPGVQEAGFIWGGGVQNAHAIDLRKTPGRVALTITSSPVNAL